MIINQYDANALSDAFGIQTNSLEGLVFNSGWGRVLPGQSSNSHQHDETEFFVIVAGEGELLVNGHRHQVKAGTVALFEPFESHVITNTSTTDLVFFLQYWRDAKWAVRSALSKERQNHQGRPQFVFSTPPTPNGDLHLGHLSGPYLGADAYVRYQRLVGNRAWHLTGSDDYQSYVVALAEREGSTPEELAAHYSMEIRETLRAMDIEIDQYTVTDAVENYHSGVKQFFSKIVQSGKVESRTATALVDDVTGEYLYEVNVSGGCPGCGGVTNGNICEECGEPNIVTDLIAPVSKISNKAPVLSEVQQHLLPLHDFAEVVADHHKLGRVPARIKELAQRVFKRSSLDVPVTHFSDWGVSPSEKDSSGQVLWVWPEMSFGFLYGIEALGARLNEKWRAEAPQEDWKIVHFFGYDNSFYHGILYPALYSLAHPEWKPDIDYHYNEFYLLDGKKFSTSRRHAVWGKEILNPSSVDAVRYYLCLTRPEGVRTNFRMADYEKALKETLIGCWQTWLVDLGTRVSQTYGGKAPDAGIWTREHSAFLAQLTEHLSGISNALNSDGFSLRRAARKLNEIVEETIAFSSLQKRLAVSSEWKDEARTSIALELAAAQLLSRVARPLMPRFAKKLAFAISEVEDHAWPETVDLVLPGANINLDKVTYFALPITTSQDAPEKIDA
ncbi:class I tRNA ligase family protein [Pseudomonas coronafaciens]|uniref:class I tRNA ligase family protein n=1 Tax=Pseudomonas coronafaciens TaxID=53409 RepID=UPI000EFE037D|nr:class I tRNA ligase family protein [Pseudomonas coronafaciens]RMV63317.1 hypothetical protein ALP06_200346 [Pseudomonas coronafaciens pv. atropurpurea]